MNRTLLKTFLSATLGFIPATALMLVPQTAQAAPTGTIQGVVKDKKTGEAIEGALIILQCNCLQGEMEAQTNSRGIYNFANLPPGQYTIQVLKGQANVSKVTTLPNGAKFRANFTVDPEDKFRRKIVVDATPVHTDTAGSVLTVDMEQAKNLPVGANTSRDFTAVVDLVPTASRDAAGISLAGTTGAESKYTIEGANVNNPAFGTVGATVIQEFIESVEITEAGYDAEYGGASGGQVSARRVSGTNQVRGEAGVRFSPRLANPRFISSTDEALRVTQVGDFQAQAYAIVSGPIKKDKLYFTIGVVPTGTQFSLTQSFYSRVDKDGSGGFEDCPFENGNNDCADGKKYIQTQKFTDQTFKTGAINFGYIAGLDYSINPKHRLRLTVQGGPSFNRTTFRLPFSFDPNSYGTNPGADPLGGTSNIATGIVNDHFGYNLQNSTLVTLGYTGRVLDDKLELDAGLDYFRAGSEDAWRLDNPDLKKITATQESDTQGRNLYEFLDRENALASVPGVDEACNRSDLPGLACPTRRWLSGGLGEYDVDSVQRVAGRFNLTHFFDGAGSHQLKYGANVEWLQRRSVYTYSGHNEDDFYTNCDAGDVGGGEWCYSDSGGYDLDSRPRVNNHRFIVVDTDRPDDHYNVGFGRVRKEENDLRALADPIGRGIRADSYDETLSTFNYAMFLQDKWAILSNLSLNVGVRWELQDMRSIMGDSAIFIKDNVGPRVGVVYDWTDEGKSRLYASYGWFFQPLPLQLNSRVFGGLVSVTRLYRLSDCDTEVTTAQDENGVAQTHPRFEGGQPTEWCTDTNFSTSGLTKGGVVPRLRGQYNQQFQVGYEQEIVEDLVLGFRWLHTDLGRAVEDVSTDGGQKFIIANPGVAVEQSDINKQAAVCDQLQADYDDLEANDPDSEDKTGIARELVQCQFLVNAYEQINTLYDSPTRNFDSWTFEFKKRFAKNWLLLASYSYSRLIGNYDGFVDPTTGAINLGSSFQYDTPELVRNSFGPLSSNIPHRAKLDGFYSFDLKAAGRLTTGTSFRVQSGFPISIKGGYSRVRGTTLIYVLPRGAGGRIQPNYSWNASIGWAYPLPKDLELEFTARVLNLTNAKAVLRVDQNYTYQDSRPIAGGDLEDLKHAKAVPSSGANDFFNRQINTPQGNYGVETSFQQPLSAQFELKLRF